MKYLTRIPGAFIIALFVFLAVIAEGADRQ